MLLNLKETSPKFITTLFTVAKSLKQPRCPSKNERKERKVYIQQDRVQPLKDRNSVCEDMDEPGDYYAESCIEEQT